MPKLGGQQLGVAARVVTSCVQDIVFILGIAEELVQSYIRHLVFLEAYTTDTDTVYDLI